jgi:hypothetical protein
MLSALALIAKILGFVALWVAGMVMWDFLRGR